MFNLEKKESYRKITIFIFVVAVIIYLYFTYDNYENYIEWIQKFTRTSFYHLVHESF